MKYLKLSLIVAFVLFGGAAFLDSARPASAGDGDKAKIDDILGRVATYKEWPQVQKPPKAKEQSPDNKPGSVVAGVDPLTFSDFAAGG